ncbi:MAG: outer membrane protein assembly factor BamB family protein, partial [Planctomycetota bacterium]
MHHTKRLSVGANPCGCPHPHAGSGKGRTHGPAPTFAATVVILLGILMSPLTTTVQAGDARAGALARKLVSMGGVDRGLCAVIGGPRDLPVQIAQCSNLLVHVREPDPSVVAIQRRLAEEAGLGIDRHIIEQGGLDKLPYADNMVDVVIATRADAGTLARLSASEVLRVLTPDGRMILAATGGTTSEQLRKWARAGKAESVKIKLTDGGAWLTLSKPPLEGVDEWSHWEHAPDNNPVSTDTAIKAPYMTQFLAEPYYIGMPAITTAAGGRTFLATGHIAHHLREWDMLNKLIARNGYNGTVLWQRDLPEGYLAHRSAFVATKDIFYMMDGGCCLMLDARTGEEKGRIQIPGMEGDWKWMAMKNGVLYAMAGEKGGGAKTIKGDRNFGGWSWADLSAGYYRKPRVPWGFGNRLAAFRLEDECLLWQHKEDMLIDSRGLAMRDGKLFLYCPDCHLHSLDSETGKVVWTNDDSETLGLIEQPGRGLVSTPGFRSGCIAVAGPESLIIQGQTRMNVIAVSTKNGELLWQKKKITNNPNAIFLDDQAVLGVGPGSQHVAIDPVTGSVLDNYKFRKAACTRLTAT